MIYRKKPIVIEAFQYIGNLYNVPQWAVEAFEKNVLFYGIDGDRDELHIMTLEGIHHVSVGDYVIRGVAGELYPCKPYTFEQTYEEWSE